MKLTKLVLLVALVGCGKPSNLGRMQEEAEGVAKRAQPEVAELQHRLASVKSRSQRIPDDGTVLDRQLALQTIGAAGSTLDKLKSELDRAPAKIAEAAKTSEDALQHETDELREHVRDNLTVATTYIQTAESWIANAETAPKQPRQIDPSLMPPTE